MARALLLAERGRGRTSPNPMVGAVVVDAEGVVVGRGVARARGRAARGGSRPGRRRRSGARRDALLHARAVLPHRPHRALRAARRRGRHPARRDRGRGSEPARCAAAASSTCATHGVDVEVGVLADGGGAPEPAVLHLHAQRPAVRDVEGGAQPGRAMVAARRGVRTALTGPDGERARASGARRGRRASAIGSGTVLVDDPLLTARGVVSRPAADARRLRPPAAHAADGAAVLDARRGPGHNRDHGECERARARCATRVEALVEPPAPRSSVSREPGVPARGAGAARRARDVMSLIVEGGPTLHAAFWRAGLVDRVELFVSPHASAPDGVEWVALPAAASSPSLTLDMTRVGRRPLGDRRGQFRGICSQG